MANLRFERTIEFHAPLDDVWRLMADTDRLNRETDLPMPTFRFQPRSVGGTEAFGLVKFGPFVFRYREHPFEWVQNQFYSVRRSFENGPIAEILARFEFEPNGDGTKVKVTTEIACRSTPIVGKIVGLRSLSQLTECCHSFEKYFAKASKTPYPRETGRPPSDAARLEKSRAELVMKGHDPIVCNALCSFISSAPPADLVNFRPIELAAKLELDSRELLNVCLTATRLGITDLNWRIMCPYCRSNKDVVTSLALVDQKAHCESCNIRFDSAFDKNVEVIFSVSHNIRPVVFGAYCIGGPQLSPHAIAQWILEPEETRLTKLELKQNRWQFSSLQASNSPSLSIRSDGPNRCSVRLKGGKIELSSDHISSHAEISLVNETTERVVIRLEEEEWRSKAVTAAEVSCLQVFRDQFSSEVLAPGLEISVSQVCILFTDLKGSTRMYREKGDANSYATVREHFTRLKRCITNHQGAVVKTIGDAIMACFHDPKNAVLAALEIQSADDPLITKIGLHWGPAIVVNANDILDYFGRTVNLASRLQKQSVGGDIVISADLVSDAGVGDAIRAFGAQSIEFTAEVPDIEGEMKLVRLIPGKN